MKKKVCSKFSAVELPREAEAQKCRQGARQSGATGAAVVKKLNLFTYKWHSLGDYVSQIRLFGGTDGFSTQIVCCIDIVSQFRHSKFALQGELAHRLVKRLYGLTNKRNAPKQIAKRYRRMERAHQAMQRHQMQAKRQNQHLSDLLPPKDVTDDHDLRYYISPSQNTVVPLYQMLHTNGASHDPALKVSREYKNLTIELIPYQGFLSETSRASSWPLTWT